MAKDQHEIADKLSTEMRQIFEAAENNIIISTSSELTKKNTLAQKQKNILEKAKNVANVVDREIAKTTNSKELIKETRKFTGLMLNNAAKSAMKTAKKINRLTSVDDIQRSIYEQTKLGIDKGVKIKTSRGNMGYKEYMEMKVRTNIQSEISERQLEIGEKAKIVFYIVNKFADCADDHAEYQGKVYYDERWQTFGFTEEAERMIAKRILDDRMLSVQQVRNGEPYLTTRPNCRHSFKPIPIDTAINIKSEKILEDNQWTTGSYRPSNYSATQQQRTNERNIRKYKSKSEMNMQMYKQTGNERFLNDSRRANVIYKKYRKQQIDLLNENPELERDYRRESTNILLNDLGVKYNMPKEDKVVLNINTEDVILGDKQIYEPFVNTGVYSQERINNAKRFKDYEEAQFALSDPARIMVMKKREDDPDIMSLKGYLLADYKSINKHLRGFELNDADTLDSTGVELYARDISQILSENKLKQDIIVKRFLDANALRRLFNFSKEDYKALKDGNFDLIKGKSFVEKGFMSTTTLPQAPSFLNEMDLQMEIFVPKGTRAMYVSIDDLTANNESEVLIDKGYEYRITDFEIIGKNNFGENKYKAKIELIHIEEENNE